MTEDEALKRMKFPRDFRGNRKIFQIWVTRACDKSCFGCTQGSNLAGKPGMITIEQYEQAVKSMQGYPGVIAMFGGNPCLHPDFEELCEIARAYIPYRQRGIWTNNLFGRGKVCRATFNPAMSNFNVHLDQEAAAEFRRDWPETKSMLKGLNHDCSHSPMFVAMKDLDKLPFPDGTRQANTEENRWELISNCDINQKWSAMIGVFRGELRGWFCEIAGSQSMLHQNDPNYPDTGLPVVPGWWKRPPEDFYDQVRKHCHECGAPCRGIGDLAVNGTREQVSLTHLEIYKPKQRDREVELVHSVDQLGRNVPHVTDYLANYRYQGEGDS